MSNMDTLLVKRRIIKGQITRLETTVDRLKSETVTETSLKLYHDKVDKLSLEAEQMYDDIANHCKEEEFETHELEYNNLIERLESLKLFFLSNSKQFSSSTNHGVAKSDIRLPKLELPSFNGKFEDWLPFHDLFTATVHNNTSLSGAQKLQYLKSSLQNDAALLIHSIPVTDGNYIEAWEILMNRFNNNREIIDAQITKLFKQPCVIQESANALRRLLDTTTECIRSLKVLQEPVQHWDAILLHIIKEKLDLETRRQWELSLKGTHRPTFEELSTFLEQRARALAASQPTHETAKLKNPTFLSSRQRVTTEKRSTIAHHSFSRAACIVCNEVHPIYKCPTFLQSSCAERINIVKRYSMCRNCLQINHKSADCKSGNCRKCNFRHNTLLHQEEQSAVSSPKKSDDISVATHVLSESNHNQVLLSTAVVLVKDSQNRLQPVKALLDSASQASFITERCAQRLQLKRKRTCVSITGIGSCGASTSRNIVELSIHSSLDSTVNLSVGALVIQKVTKVLPTFPCDVSKWSHFKGLQLADPTFHKPSEVDILLGADIYIDCLQGGLCKGPSGTPSALNTVFGWTISGQINKNQQSTNISVHHCNIDESLKRFWEIEEISERVLLTDDEIRCEKHFSETHSRDTTGRYTVRLPFKNSCPKLGDSRNTAIRRFLSVEKRIQVDPKLHEQYCDFMDEYIRLGHMKEISSLEVNKNHAVYLPHHAVIKETSTTTKLRVVFDASAKTTSGVSLNDELLVGPKLQDDLQNLLIRFRLPIIAMTADLEKMYRQIKIHSDDDNYQRIIWRSSPNEPIKDYKLVTVTYGTSAAPYLATKVLQQLSEDEKEQHPQASQTLSNDFYVDDLMTGANSIQEALDLQAQLIELTKKGGFNLRKWASNATEILEAVPSELREIQTPLKFDLDETVKTLGLQWHPASDHFSFSITFPSVQSSITKRTMLSGIAKLFDPLGLLAPVTVRAKILLQELWYLKLGWDDILPSQVASKWLSFQEELQDIECINIQRCISQENAVNISLHGFCDASEKAYAAAVYLRSSSANGQVAVNLIVAKTKVAPLKQVTLPRLELCAAVLLIRLMKLVKSSLKVDIDTTHAWSDSTIVLAWLSSPPQRWKTFVANRVSEIQETLPETQWHHVRSSDNPADCASRGITVNGLHQFSLWWYGPQWLHDSDLTNASYFDCQQSNVTEEERVVKVIHADVDHTLLSSYSSLNMLRRVTAYIQRFINNSRSASDTRLRGPLTVQELENALFYWIREVQNLEFHDEIQAIKTNRPLPAKSKILQLHPFLDKDGVLRVGGRLKHARLTPDQIHPILLPRKNKLSDLLISHEHVTSFHGGAQLVMTSLQKRYWILGARDAIRFHIGHCIRCVRQRASTAQQIMGDLPAARVNPARPFQKCGVDYAGPFLLRVMKGRGHKMFKAYIAVFICFTTRAIHLELVSDLSTTAFLAALKRFIARRGKPNNIYSDCGTNFKGADHEMKEFLKLTTTAAHNNEVAKWLSNEGISWHFNPAAAPHFGGLWEAGVKAVKYHLKRVVGATNLTFEEMETLLCQIEACLNSRPLTPLSNDPNEFCALTPGHFLIGDSLTAVPEPDYTSTMTNRLTRWQLCQKLVQHFWKRWQNEYLSRLQKRPKWLVQKDNLKVGDLVLLKDENMPPTKWKMGRILHLHPGADSFVRVVTVKTADSEFKRPVVKLCPLPID